MKLADFQKPAASQPAAPATQSSEPAQEPAPQEAQFTTATTPSGLEIEYHWAPRRKYLLNGTEVPSVTTVLGVLDKSGPLTWWGQKVGVQGVLELLKKKALIPGADGILFARDWLADDGTMFDADAQEIVELLTQHKLTVNHVKDQAADRGVNVHGALEQWCLHGQIPDWTTWPENEQQYIKGLAEFFVAIEPAVDNVEWSVESELMVGSLTHQYAGRFDLVLTLDKPCEVVTRHYPKKADKVETIPAGRYLMDLKTRKKAAVYDTNYMQLEAYEAAAVECGYQPTDYRAVIVVTEDGGYQVSVNQDWTLDDFLAVRRVYSVLNEREVLRVLREDLDAKEIK